MNTRISAEEQQTIELVAGTDKEVLDAAFLHDEDLDGEEGDEERADTSLEEMEDPLEDGIPDDDAEDGDEEEPDSDGDEEEGDEDGGEDPDAQEAEAQDARSEERTQVPSGRLREETERRRLIEQERDALRAQVAAFQQQQQRPPQPPEQQQPGPDIFSDPEGWARAQRQELEREFTARHVNASLADAHEEHGEEFVAAYTALTNQNRNDPMAVATVQRIWDAPNPGRALMRWHEQQKAVREIGSDPSAYRERIAREIMSDPQFRRQVLDGMRNDAMQGNNGRPRTATRLPKSLNGASGGNSRRNGRDADPGLYDDSDGSVFDYAMR